MSVTVELPQSGVLPVKCPAAEPLAGCRHPKGFEVPAVRCRIVHENFDLEEHARTVGLACCQSAANVSPEPAPGTSPDQRAALRKQVGFEHCDIWQFDKAQIEQGRKSLGDEQALDAANDRAYRQDLTRSEYGDTSFMEELDRQANETAAKLQEMRESGQMFESEPGDA